MKRPSRKPRVLSNVMEMESNPYVELWNEAVERSGAQLVSLGPREILARNAHPDWVHLQWPEHVLVSPSLRHSLRASSRLLLLVAIGRARGARVLLTVHNVRSHEVIHPQLERALFTAISRLTTDLHLLSAASQFEVTRAFPALRAARHHVIPHGNYRPLMKALPSREIARAELGIEPGCFVVTTFGLLRRYKGVPELVRVWADISSADSMLVVAGQVRDSALDAELARAEAENARVRVIRGFLEHSQLSTVLRASDLVVLPYRQILNSGSALLALTNECPVLLPRTPTFEELRDLVGGDWVRLFDSPLTSQTLRANLIPPPTGTPQMDWSDWGTIVEHLRILWSRH